jgi:hypothetical protein
MVARVSIHQYLIPLSLHLVTTAQLFLTEINFTELLPEQHINNTIT